MIVALARHQRPARGQQRRHHREDRRHAERNGDGPEDQWNGGFSGFVDGVAQA